MCAVGFLLVVLLMKLKDKEKMECFVHTLNKIAIVDDTISESVGLHFGSEEHCEELVERSFEEALNETATRLDVGSDDEDTKSCILRRLKEHEVYKATILISQVLEYSKISLKFWNYFEVKKQLTHSQEGRDLIEYLESYNCDSSKQIPDTNLNNDNDGGDDYDFEGSASSETPLKSNTKSKLLNANKIFNSDDDLIQVQVNCRNREDSNDDDEGSGLNFDSKLRPTNSDNLISLVCVPAPQRSKRDDGLYFEP